MAGAVNYAAPKQVAESPTLSIDFTDMLNVSESFALSGVTVKIFQRGVPGTDLTGTILVGGSVAANGNVVSFRVQAGTDGDDYVARVTVVTSTPRSIISQIIFPVRDRPYEAYGIQIMSVEECLADLGLAPEDYLRIESLLNAATTRIENYCHSMFRRRTLTNFYTGWPFNLLDLGAPVLSTTGELEVSILHDAVLQTYDLLDPSTYTILNARGQLFRYFGWTYFSAIGTPSPATWFFLPNMKNVQVVGDFGWDPIPDDVTQVCLSLVRFWNSLRGREGLLEERIGEYTYRTQLGGRASGGNVEQDGIPTEILAPLDPYVRHPV